MKDKATTFAIDKFLRRMTNLAEMNVGDKRDAMLTWAAEQVVDNTQAGKNVPFKTLGSESLPIAGELLQDPKTLEAVLGTGRRAGDVTRNVAQAVDAAKHSVTPAEQEAIGHDKNPESARLMLELTKVAADTGWAKVTPEIASDRATHIANIKRKIPHDPMLEVQAANAWIAAGRPEPVTPPAEKQGFRDRAQQRPESAFGR